MDQDDRLARALIDVVHPKARSRREVRRKGKRSVEGLLRRDVAHGGTAYSPHPALPERLKRSPGTNVSNARIALKRNSRGATPRAPLAWADGRGARGRVRNQFLFKRSP